jgi:hypothetical protein
MSGKATGGYSIAGQEDALDFMASYPGYGEQRWYSDALGTEHVRRGLRGGSAECSAHDGRGVLLAPQRH